MLVLAACPIPRLLPLSLNAAVTGMHEPLPVSRTTPPRVSVARARERREAVDIAGDLLAEQYVSGSPPQRH